MRICKKCGLEREDSEFFQWSDLKPNNPCKHCIYPAKDKTCKLCGTKWTARSGGEGRRKDQRCDSCYPFYRRAYNLFTAAKTRAVKKELEFSLTVEFIEEKLKSPCPKLGVEFDLSKNGNDYSDRKPYCPSIDKIDPRGGYTEKNIQIVCWIYNSTKQQFTDQEVIDFCRKVVDFYDTQTAKIVGVQTP